LAIYNKRNFIKMPYRVVLKKTPNEAELEDVTNRVYLVDDAAPPSAVFLHTGGSICKVYTYDPLYQSYMYRFEDDTISATDIATSTNKLWLSQSTHIKEYNLTMNPFSVSYLKTHTVSGSVGSGLCAISDTLLIGYNGGNIIQIDTSLPSPITPTILFPLMSGYQVTGDMIYNPELDNYIITNHHSSIGYAITEYHSDGTVLYTNTFTDQGYGLFVHSGALYCGKGNGVIIRVIDNTYPNNIIPITTLPFSIFGSSQYYDYTTFTFTN
jgi:hypothetical protein